MAPTKRTKLVHFSPFEFALLQHLAEVTGDTMVAVIRNALAVYAQQHPGFDIGALARELEQDVLPGLSSDKDRYRLQAELQEFHRRLETAEGAVLMDPRLSEADGEVEFDSDRDF